MKGIAIINIHIGISATNMWCRIPCGQPTWCLWCDHFWTLLPIKSMRGFPPVLLLQLGVIISLVPPLLNPRHARLPNPCYFWSLHSDSTHVLWIFLLNHRYATCFWGCSWFMQDFFPVYNLPIPCQIMWLPGSDPTRRLGIAGDLMLVTYLLTCVEKNADTSHVTCRYQRDPMGFFGWNYSFLW